MNEEMTCPECEKATMVRETRPRVRTVGRYKATDNSAIGLRCPACGETAIEGEESTASNLRVAVAVLHAVKDINGAEMKILRGLIGYTQAELAELLEVAPETVSRWEREEHGVSALHRRALADVAASIIATGGEPEALLVASRKPMATKAGDVDIAKGKAA